MTKCLLAGQQLAIASSSNQDDYLQFNLRLYDVRIGSQHRTHEHRLLPFAPTPNNQPVLDTIISSSFSPDGLFLALGREDNMTHVYDARYFDDPLYVLRHETGHGRKYGITHHDWYTPAGQFQVPLLLTAGDDGEPSKLHPFKQY